MAMKQEGQIEFQTPFRDFLKVSAAAGAAPLAVFNIEPETAAAPFYGEPAKLPASDMLTWGKEPIEAGTNQRATVYLNGICRIMPCS
jgi:hypothetical protein